MPLGKYYCDYCEKEFQDTPAARKRHLSGLQHQRARALWYDSLKDPHGGSSDGGFGRGVCNHFVRTGICKYGDACKYFHPKQNIASPAPTAPSPGMNYVQILQPPNISGTQFIGGNPMPGDMVRDHMGVSWGNLPPSLRPPPEGGYPPFPFVDWG